MSLEQTTVEQWRNLGLFGVFWIAGPSLVGYMLYSSGHDAAKDVAKILIGASRGEFETYKDMRDAINSSPGMIKYRKFWCGEE